MDPTDYVYYICTPDSFHPCSLYPVRWLDWEDDFLMAQAYWASLYSPLEHRTWLEARDLGYRYAALIDNGAVISCAAAWNYSTEKSELSAVTTANPAMRYRGYAKNVCSFITQYILTSGQIATVSTSADNLPMQRTAESLGYRGIAIEEGLKHQRMMNLHLQQRLAALKHR